MEKSNKHQLQTDKFSFDGKRPPAMAGEGSGRGDHLLWLQGWGEKEEKRNYRRDTLMTGISGM